MIADRIASPPGPVEKQREDNHRTVEVGLTRWTYHETGGEDVGDLIIFELLEEEIVVPDERPAGGPQVYDNTQEYGGQIRNGPDYCALNLI